MQVTLQTVAPATAAQARDTALAVLAEARFDPEGFVEYQSAGVVAILGPGRAALGAARALAEQLTCLVVDEDDSAEGEPDADRFVVAVGRPNRVAGYLGRFDVTVAQDGRDYPLGQFVHKDRPQVDLVLDLADAPHIAFERPPVGYFRAGTDESRLAEALATLPGMVGEFQKPRFFNYRETLCAHGARGITGCTRCLDACATGAIRSLGETVEIDPYLCQGCGSCATVCPSGAMTYALPSGSDLLGVLRRALEAYRGAGGRAATLLFHNDESGADYLGAHDDVIGADVIPVSVEDVGAIGPEAWFALLAFGAADIVLLLPDDVEPLLHRSTTAQIDVAREILEGLGESASRVRIARTEGLVDTLGAGHDGAPHSHDRRFSVSGSKREIWQRALAALANPIPAPFDLSPGAPFGEVQVNRTACTLCMACAAVCPAEALTSAGKTPQLLFEEDRCLQCGICEQACPEDAITLRPRMAVMAQTNPGQPTVANEEKPFHCVGCGKAFATEKMIDHITAQLSGHRMFEGERALRRLKMCDDCRVRDVLTEEGDLDRFTG